MTKTNSKRGECRAREILLLLTKGTPSERLLTAIIKDPTMVNLIAMDKLLTCFQTYHAATETLAGLGSVLQATIPILWWASKSSCPADPWLLYNRAIAHPAYINPGLIENLNHHLYIIGSIQGPSLTDILAALWDLHVQDTVYNFVHLTLWWYSLVHYGQTPKHRQIAVDALAALGAHRLAGNLYDVLTHTAVVDEDLTEAEVFWQWLVGVCGMDPEYEKSASWAITTYAAQLKRDEPDPFDPYVTDPSLPSRGGKTT